MGILFKHTDDINVVRRIFPDIKSVELIDENLYMDGSQAGKAIRIDGVYDLVPVHMPQGNVRWCVWATECNDNGCSGSCNECHEDAELCRDKTFEDAVKFIYDDRMDFIVEGIMNELCTAEYDDFANENVEDIE